MHHSPIPGCPITIVYLDKKVGVQRIPSDREEHSSDNKIGYGPNILQQIRLHIPSAIGGLAVLDGASRYPLPAWEQQLLFEHLIRWGRNLGCLTK